jgi:hypothetical protein
MMLGHVNGRKIIVVAFKFWSVEGDESESRKKGFDFAFEVGGGVKVSERGRGKWWLGNINPLTFELGC